MKTIQPEPPAVVQGTETLENLARLVNGEHAAQEVSARDAAQRARRIGDRLLEAKARCGHGKWTEWLKKHVKFSDRLARKYMEVAANWSRLEPDSDLATIYRFLAAEGQEDQNGTASSDLGQTADPSRPITEGLTEQNQPLCKACARAVRTGQAPAAGCPDCRELRKARPPKPVDNRPKPGTAIPEWREIMAAAFGPLLRMLDVFYKSISRKEKVEHTAALRRIGELRDQLKADYKKYTKKDPKE